MLTTLHNHTFQSRRRGSLYLSVLMVSVLVSLLGMSALVVKRVQRRNHQSAMDASQARFLAQSALRIAMLDIENDADWRYNFPNGTWEEDVPLLGGTYKIEGYDPSDGNLSDNPEEPVVLVATGTVGSARQKTQLTLTPINRGYSFLENALVSQEDVIVEDNSYVYCNQFLTTAIDFDAKTGSTIVADVEAKDAKGGGTYYGTVAENVTQEAFPETDDILSYYLARGTYINYGSIQDVTPNIVKNSTFDQNIDLWSSDSCSIMRGDWTPYSGAGHLYCYNRNSTSDAATYDITSRIEKGATYNFSLRLRPTDAVIDYFKVIIETTSNGDGTKQNTVSNLILTNTYYANLSGSITPTWSGTLTSAKIRIESRWTTTSFYVDDFVLKEPNPPAGTIFRRVLSPNHNPYGETNEEGIYIINCGGKKLAIEDCRIFGTLVLLDPKSDSQVNPGGIAWSPVQSNFPCLLVDGKFSIRATNEGLNEARDDVNYNPVGAPHNTLGEDADKVDVIPSKINGLIYTSDDLAFQNNTTIEGVVLSLKKTVIQHTFTLNYNSIFFTHPPPGFSAPETIRILLNSVQKPLD